MSQPHRKRRVERLKPGLKQLTPEERKVVSESIAQTRRRWDHLFSMNAWKPAR